MTLKNLIRSLTTRLADSYCSITVANHRLITVIRFVTKIYTHPWRGFANKLHLALHASSRSGYSRDSRANPNKITFQRLVFCEMGRAASSLCQWSVTPTHSFFEMCKCRNPCTRNQIGGTHTNCFLLFMKWFLGYFIIEILESCCDADIFF